MTQHPPTQVTSKQNEYLLYLKDGPKTSRDFILEFMVSAPNINKRLGKLQNAGLVQSTRAPGTRGNVHNYELTAPYHDLSLIVVNNNRTGNPILDEEILYAAILRNGLMTGQRLKNQYRKLFPDRTPGAINNIVATARKRRLCR